MNRPKFLLYPLGLLVLSTGIAWAGQTTLTTYYPSPTGYYNQLFAQNVGIGTTVPQPYRLSIKESVGLGSALNSTTNLLSLSNTNANANYLNFSQIRTASGSDWKTATTRIQEVTDVTNQGYMDFNPVNGNYGLAFGSRGTEYMRIANGGNVGIGTTNPSADLDVSGYLHVGGNPISTTTAQGAYLGWNALNGGTGETDFINNKGGGSSGGFAFMNTPPSGSPRSTLMTLNLDTGPAINTSYSEIEFYLNGETPANWCPPLGSAGCTGGMLFNASHSLVLHDPNGDLVLSPNDGGSPAIIFAAKNGGQPGGTIFFTNQAQTKTSWIALVPFSICGSSVCGGIDVIPNPNRSDIAFSLSNNGTLWTGNSIATRSGAYHNIVLDPYGSEIQMFSADPTADMWFYNPTASGKGEIQYQFDTSLNPGFHFLYNVNDRSGALPPPGGVDLMDLDRSGNLTVRGNLIVNGTITSGANKNIIVGVGGCFSGSLCASDQRLKQNIQALTGALSKLDGLRGVSFEWNHSATSVGLKEGQKNIGMIAQELQKVYPELVESSKHGDQEYLSIDYAKFTAVLLQSVKELKSQMNAMQDQINALQRKVKTPEKQK